MTPTATKAEPSATEVERQLGHELAEANGQLDEARDRSAQHHVRIRALQGELMGRRVEHRQEFDELGVPRAKTQAAKLGDELELLHTAGANLNAAQVAAETVVQRAEQRLVDHRNGNARQLFRELMPEAERVRREWSEWASQG